MPGSLICYLNKVCPKILKLMKGKLSKMHVHVSSSTHYHFSLGKNHKNKNQFLTEIYNGKCLPGISFLRFEVTWNTLHNFSLLSSEYIYLCKGNPRSLFVLSLVLKPDKLHVQGVFQRGNLGEFFMLLNAHC